MQLHQRRGPRASVPMVNFAKAVDHKPEYRRTPLEVLVTMTKRSRAYLQRAWAEQFLLAVVAGSFIGFGAALSIFLSAGVTTTGPRNLLLGTGFGFGFFLVVTSGAALFTEVNVVVPVSMFFFRVAHKRQPADTSHSNTATAAACARFWATVWIGNLVGAVLVAALFRGGLTLENEEIKASLEAIVATKIQPFKDHGVRGWFGVVISAIAGNWLVGMAAFLASSARTLIGKFIGVLPPVIAFASLGVQHSTANMAYLMISLINNEDTAYGVGDCFGWNLVPATIGNLIGGTVMVASAFFYAYGAHEDAIWEDEAPAPGHAPLPQHDIEEAQVEPPEHEAKVAGQHDHAPA